ncbi:hypothetical protein HUU90_27820 [Burkholderia glumae]|uniref:hypothetical protein n=1 Tax=Burkholderia glumae TaxID=337 RepID=UPI0015949C42|nr:hypothetical protein [Burkholderia glumae]NVE26145.1 hypothetical protein [Burkholderia glumae]
MPNSPVMPSVEQYQALLAERDALRGELRLVTAQRDLAEEKRKRSLKDAIARRG